MMESNTAKPHLSPGPDPVTSSASLEGKHEHLSVEKPLPETDTEPTAETEIVYPTGTKFWFTVIACSVIIILAGLDANIVSTAVPSITNEFQTVADVGWYSSAFRLCTCAFQFAFAKAYKHFSIKIVFLISNVLFLLGSLICALASSSPMFVVGRAICGLGFAGEVAGCFAVLVHILPLHKRPVYSGFMAAVEQSAVIAAPVVGGALTQSLGWRWCFWINLPIGGLALILMLFIFSDPRSRPDDDIPLREKIRELDLLSNCLFVPSLSALFLALSWAGTKYAWSDGRVVGPLVVFAVLLAAFVYNQYRRGDSAVLPFRVLNRRTVIAGAIFTMCTNSLTNVLEWYLPTYYQVVRSRSPGASGYLMTPILGGMMVGLILQGIGTTAIGYYAPFMIFGSVCMPIAAGLMTTYDLYTSLAKIILTSAFVGFSGGIGFQGPQFAVQTILPDADVHLGIGVILFGQSMGPAVFVAVAQVIFTNELLSGLRDVVPDLTPSYIEERGLGEILQDVPAERVNEALRSISRSLTTTWYLPVALGCTTFVGSLLIEWRSVKQNKPKKDEEIHSDS